VNVRKRKNEDHIRIIKKKAGGEFRKRTCRVIVLGNPPFEPGKIVRASERVRLGTKKKN